MVALEGKGESIGNSIHHPLETSLQDTLVVTPKYNLHPITYQSTDHHNTDGQSVPQPSEANITIDAAHCSAKGLTRLAVGIQLAHHHICGMGHNSAENTGQVSTGEGNRGLSALVVVGFLSRQSLVDHFHNGLKRGKLHHGVGDLTAPEGIQTFVKPA